MSHASSILGVIAVLLVPVVAAADPDRSPDVDLIPHVTGGYELESADHITTNAFRGQAFLDGVIGHGRIRPVVGLGGMVSGGGARPDVMGTDTSSTSQAALGYWSVGPALELGVQLYDDHQKRSAYLYANAAYLRASLTSSDANTYLAFNTMTGGTDGWRIAIGADLGAALWNALEASDSNSDGATAQSLGLVFLPHDFQLVAENDLGTQRYGFMIGWGF